MFVVDTDVLIYASDRTFREHARCRGLAERWRHGVMPWFLTWGIVSEYLRVVTHPKILARPLAVNEAWSSDG